MHVFRFVVSCLQIHRSYRANRSKTSHTVLLSSFVSCLITILPYVLKVSENEIMNLGIDSVCSNNDTHLPLAVLHFFKQCLKNIIVCLYVS